MYRNHKSFIEEPGWLRRMVGTGYIYKDEPCVSIPLSWLGLSDQEGNPYVVDPALIAADYLAYQRIKETHISVSMESIRHTLAKRRREKGGEEE